MRTRTVILSGFAELKFLYFVYYCDGHFRRNDSGFDDLRRFQGVMEAARRYMAE